MSCISRVKILCLAAVFFTACSQTTEINKLLFADRIEGNVGISHDEGLTWDYLEENDIPLSGDLIKTLDDSYCDLILPDVGLIRLMGNTELYFQQATNDTYNLDIVEGEAVIGFPHTWTNGEMIIETADVMTVPGSNFYVIKYETWGKTTVLMKSGVLSVDCNMKIESVNYPPAREYILNQYRNDMSEYQSVDYYTEAVNLIEQRIDFKMTDLIESLTGTNQETNADSSVFLESTELNSKIDGIVEQTKLWYGEAEVKNIRYTESLDLLFYDLPSREIESRITNPNVQSNETIDVDIEVDRKVLTGIQWYEEQQEGASVYPEGPDLGPVEDEISRFFGKSTRFNNNSDYRAAWADTSVNLMFIYHPDYSYEDMTVYLTGDFIEWNPSAPGLKLQHREDGKFYLSLEFLPGTYEFSFVINGKQVDDMRLIENLFSPSADYYQEDEQGRYVSVIQPR